MTIKEATELMLARMNTRNQFVGGTFGGWAGGTTGNIQMQQREANQAITLWLERHDVSGLVQFAKNLHAYGNLSDADYTQIMESLDGEN
ncbi:MAG TPA: hypothetical protein VGM08_03525 [Candidatus Saccharimonadales bacterium]|jgi:hypothetical protein